jgi:hypothetical protein
MFYHEYGRNDRMLLRDWAPVPGRAPFHCEKEAMGSGGAFLDEELNLLLVVLAREPGPDFPRLHSADYGTVSVDIGDDDSSPSTVKIERQEDIVEVVFPDGTRKKSRLADNQAATLWTKLECSEDGLEGVASPMLSALSRSSEGADATLRSFFNECEQYLRELVSGSGAPSTRPNPQSRDE